MKPSSAITTKEPESQTPGGEQRAVEPEGRWRDKGEADTERQRTRERLEATLAGLAELEFLRQRQELLVQSVLRSPGAGAGARAGAGAGGVAPTRAGELQAPGEASQRSRLEEKDLEENILLLRRQLNCLRRRDAGLLNQLQELDKQISDLRLDVEKTSEEHLETDSRTSSGFYELSDGASGSLSNSSNSVFCECLSSCHSSTCFCSPLETSLNISDGHPKSADEETEGQRNEVICQRSHNIIRWLDHKESHGEDVCRSLSIPQSSTLEVIADVNPKYQCDLISKNGNDIYRYPSPLHAVAVQSPMFLLSMTNNPLKDEKQLGNSANDVCNGSEVDSVKADNSSLPQSNSMSVSYPASSKKIDGYILSLVQKKTHPVRTNKLRTSVNADPMKGILRHGSICVRATDGITHSNSVNLKNSKQACLHSGETSTLENGTFSPLKQWLKDSKGEQLESRRMPVSVGCPPNVATDHQSKHLPKNVKPGSQEFAWCPVSGAGDSPKESGQLFTASPKESPGRVPALQQENKVVQPLKKMSQKTSSQAALPAISSAVPRPLPLPSSLPIEERPALDFKSEGSSSQSLEDGLLVSAQFIPGQQQNNKLHRANKNVKILKSSTLKHRAHGLNGVESGLQTVREKSRVVSKKCHFPDDLDTNKKFKKVSSRGKKGGNSQAEAGLSSRSADGLHRPVTKFHGHGHGREAVVAKLKHKRTDYRRWKSSAEISYEEALRRARRNRREPMGVYNQVPLPYVSPYAYVASDSEYSAECESLFHSTVVDTSEDEQSNYTTNCFGDSESSLSEIEFVGESTTTSDSEESGGLIWSQFVQTLPLQAGTAPALHDNHTMTFVKIKASHNLKKKILRFRSGSLKLMTTV